MFGWRSKMKLYTLDSIPKLDCNEMRLSAKEAQLLQIIRDLATETISLRERIDCLERK
jgi:hypothetical protein